MRRRLAAAHAPSVVGGRTRELHGDREWTRSPPVPVVFNPSPPITTNANCQYVVKRLQKVVNARQSSHTDSTVYSPCKNNSPSTDSADSIFLPSSSVRPARENDRSDGKMYSKCTVKCMASGVPMHAHRAHGVPAGCWTHPCGDQVLLASSPRLNRELYPHTHGFPVGPARNPLSPSRAVL